MPWVKDHISTHTTPFLRNHFLHMTSCFRPLQYVFLTNQLLFDSSTETLSGVLKFFLDLENALIKTGSSLRAG